MRFRVLPRTQASEVGRTGPGRFLSIGYFLLEKQADERASARGLAQPAFRWLSPAHWLELRRISERRGEMRDETQGQRTDALMPNETAVVPAAPLAFPRNEGVS